MLMLGAHIPAAGCSGECTTWPPPATPPSTGHPLSSAVPLTFVCVLSHSVTLVVRIPPATPGGWNLAQSPEMKWSEGDLWNIALELQVGSGCVRKDLCLIRV